MTFKVKNYTHSLQITAYTTTLQILIQPVNEKNRLQKHFDSNHNKTMIFESRNFKCSTIAELNEHIAIEN